MTRWAAQVSPSSARPEYPRPQFARRQWQSLNGLWDFAFDDQDEGRSAGWSSRVGFPQTILVPFTFESALSGIGRGSEVHERVWYHRSFTVPSSWRGRRLLLNFGASDWETTVWVNGKQVGSHKGGYTPFTFEITRALQPGRRQDLVVAVYDPAKGPQPKGKQLGSRGIWYTRTTGLWQSVWLEPVERTYLSGVTLIPSVREQSLVVQATVEGPTEGARVYVTPSFQGASFDSLWGPVQPDGKASVILSMHAPHLWSPEEPNLYDLKLEVRRNGRRVDEVSSYCGFRSIETRRGRLCLNGEPYFLRGVLDQGFWPDGIYTPPTDDALRADVEAAKAFGFNLARKHVKVEDPRWYYWCDRLGLLVSQDMPSSHDLRTQEARSEFLAEWPEVMRATWNHPSVVLWIPFNENWGNPGAFQDDVVRLTQRIDRSRPIIDASGWTQRSLTDVIDTHDYGSKLVAQGVEDPVKPKIVGEFGGIALPVREHTWTRGWGYQTALGPRSLMGRYSNLVRQLFAAPNLSGFVYTQLTDVEQEMNGLMTYDRQPKVAPERLRPLTLGNPLPPVR